MFLWYFYFDKLQLHHLVDQHLGLHVGRGHPARGAGPREGGVVAREEEGGSALEKGRGQIEQRDHRKRDCRLHDGRTRGRSRMMT